MKRILIVMCAGYLVSLHAMDHLHSISTPRTHSPLFDAIHEKDIERVQTLLDQGEDVNALYPVSDETPLMEAATNGLTDICKLLLKRGADVRLEEFNGETVFRQVMCGGYLWHEESDDENEIIDDFKKINDVFSALLVDSMFVPYSPQSQMNDDQHRIVAILCALRSICPKMPRDIRYKILSSEAEVMKSALHCPFGLHRGHYERTPLMPYSITRLLLKERLLDENATVLRLKIHKMEILRPILEKSWVDFFPAEEDEIDDEMEDEMAEKDRRITVAIKEASFWPTRDNWEAHYTPQIEDAIREKLGLMHK
jgi:hypothetical protein